MSVPFGVVVNRIHHACNCVTDYCYKQDIPVLLQIPEDREIAEANSRGETLLSAVPELMTPLQDVLQRAQGMAQGGRV